LYNVGLSRGNWSILILAIGLLLVVDILHESGKSIFIIMGKQECFFRWISYVGIVWIIIMFGIYGTQYDASTFIYFQF